MKNELLDQASQMSEKVKDLFEKVDLADKNFMDIFIIYYIIYKKNLLGIYLIFPVFGSLTSIYCCDIT